MAKYYVKTLDVLIDIATGFVDFIYKLHLSFNKVYSIVNFSSVHVKKFVFLLKNQIDQFFMSLFQSF